VPLAVFRGVSAVQGWVTGWCQPVGDRSTADPHGTTGQSCRRTTDVRRNWKSWG
jgi:hypothetical protein